MIKKYNKVVLAYSGGLDTSVIIPWLKENYSAEVICVVGDVGQGSETEGLEEKAIATGASKIYIENLVDEFIDDFAFPTLKAGAVYEGTYLLGTAIARPVIAKRLVEIAIEEGADAICHGCTGKGNDQVRFEMAVKYFAPEMPIIAPWRIWDIRSREDAFAYGEARNVPLPITRDTNYSKDKNLWHLSHEGLDLEDPANEPDYDKILELSVSPENAPDEPTYVTISYEAGVPVALNGVEMKGADLLTELNRIGGENGIGIDDMVENRLVGIKVRGVYENMGAAILYRGLQNLQAITLDRETLHFKEHLSLKFAELVYNGQWFSPLRANISAFMDSAMARVTGDAKLKLYKGNMINAGVTSPYSLYSEEFATFGEDAVYDHADAGGFITLYSLPTRVHSLMLEKNGLDK